MRWGGGGLGGGGIECFVGVGCVDECFKFGCVCMSTNGSVGLRLVFRSTNGCVRVR